MGPKKKDVLDLDDPLESKTVPRPTLPPEIEPEAFYRERMPTVTDEVALEQARAASMIASSIPPRRQAPAAPTAPTSEVIAIEEPPPRVRLAPLDRVPRLVRPVEALGPLVDDPKTAYILSFVDGILPLETILDVAGVPEIDVLRVLERFIRGGQIVFVTTA